MNAHAERFNRTIQEEFIEFHKDLLFTDIDAFRAVFYHFASRPQDDAPFNR